MASNKDLFSINYLPSDEHACWTRIPEKAVTSDMDKERIYPSNFALIPQMWLRLNALALKEIQTLIKFISSSLVDEVSIEQKDFKINRI